MQTNLEVDTTKLKILNGLGLGLGLGPGPDAILINSQILSFIRQQPRKRV